MREFTDKVVVVTGAGSGMGRAYARAFAARGARLALNDYDPEALAETVRLLGATQDPRLHAAAFDVSDAAAMQGFADAVEKALGRAHVVINNAGIEGAAKPVWATGLDTYACVMQVNFFGVVNGTKSFLPQLLANGEGAIVNVSSVFGLIAPPNHTDYSASKFAVRGFTQALMVELRDTRVGVHLVHPGGIATNIARLASTQPFRTRYLSTPPERIVEHVIRGIGRKQAKIVFGKDSFKTLLGAHLLPLKLLNRLIWHDMEDVIDRSDYPPRP